MYLLEHIRTADQMVEQRNQVGRRKKFYNAPKNVTGGRYKWISTEEELRFSPEKLNEVERFSVKINFFLCDD